ncbi:selenocysteine-specific translation elongation factor [soil metagenome]
MSETPKGHSGVIGTAGHVDHGKSTLVKAITSIDPDRLAEEKARSMTIDLGFAWKLRADGSRLSFVDVPGHERFIKNMLAGVGSIDAVLLVIAADEGPMPQTREHLAIIDLLGITSGVVALTKSDLVDDDWLGYIDEEVRELIRPTSIADSPIISVSASTGHNLDLLESTLAEQLQLGQGRIDLGRPRLSIDRAFTIEGFGTVVTGTLIDGSLRVGDEIAVLPGDLKARIRGLQVHSVSVAQAGPGNRVAVNLTGVPVESLRRGLVIALPGSLETTERIDARIFLLASAPKAIEQDDHFDFFQGAAEHPVWVTLLDREQIAPGESGWMQLRFREPVVVSRGDRFILRQASPSLTIGGGVVLDVSPPRHRRFHATVIASLEAREKGDPAQLIAQLTARRIVTRNEIDRVLSGIDEIDAAITELESRGQLVAINRELFTSTAHLESVELELLRQVDAFHSESPFRRGIPREDLRQRTSLAEPGGAFEAIVSRLVGRRMIVDDVTTIRGIDFAIQIPLTQLQNSGRWLAAIDAAPFAPPPPIEFGIEANTQLALTERGDLVRAADGIFFTAASLARVEADVSSLIEELGRVTLADVRDRFATSRKYVQAILELLDARRVTRRIGDERILLPGRKPPTTGATG